MFNSEKAQKLENKERNMKIVKNNFLDWLEDNKVEKKKRSLLHNPSEIKDQLLAELVGKGNTTSKNSCITLAK